MPPDRLHLVPTASSATTSSAGLTTVEAERRLTEWGPNEIPVAHESRLPARVLAQLRDPMLLLLMLAGGVTAVTRDLSDGIIIATVIVLNTTLGVVQEWRASRAVHQLDRLAAPWAVVVRDGHRGQVWARDVVPGDRLAVEAGDIVAADGVLEEAHSLQVDESAITGESVPRDCVAGEELEAGTVVTRGRGDAVVTRTGARSGLGRIAAVVAAAPLRRTPLQQRLGRLSAELVLLVVVLATVVLLLGLLRGRSLAEMVLVAVSLSVAAVPESLPAVASIALALGAHRMASRHAVVRRLPAVETLGSVTVLASDKTGTLTKGRMSVERLWLPSVGEVGWRDADLSGTVDAPGLDSLLRDMALCNDAYPRATGAGDGERAPGDPVEQAMLAACENGGLDVEQARARWPRVAERPFDPATRRMVTVHRAAAGERLLVCKGAPEAVIGLLDDTDERLTEVRAAATSLMETGHRVLMVGDRESAAAPLDLDEGGLRIVGLVAMSDPPRESAKGVVRALRDAGIRLVLVTGDHGGTARAVASRLGILRGGAAVVEGRQLDEVLGRGDVEDVGVFARVRPEQKVAIVAHLQQHGEVVAVTGDGVNDAPALRTADIGVSMGRSGSEVARQAAALVLADDELRTVVAAVEEGRRVYANIRTFLRYALAGGMAEVGVMLAGPFLGLVIPLLPAQILWINMLTHGLPGVAFSGEPLDRRLMKRPSRSPQESILGQGLVAQIGWGAAAITVVSLAAAVLAPRLEAHAQTCVFLTLGFGQLTVALALRARVGRRTWRQRGLEAAVGASVALQLLGAYAPALNELLGTRPVPAPALAVTVGLAVLPGALVRATVLRRDHAPAPR